MKKILVALSAFTEFGDADEIPKLDTEKTDPVPQYERVNDPDDLNDLNSLVNEAALEIGSRPDRHTRYQLQRVRQMSVRYENNTMPDENI